jgi:tetratricopeptide (TPR) repeat protein
MSFRNGPTRNNVTALLSVALFVVAQISCASPFSRFSKQYKCEIAGKPEPRSGYEYVQRGVEHARADQLECALGACAEAIRLEPKKADGYGCRASVLMQQQKKQEAVQDLNQAIKLEPNNGDYYFSRGLAQGGLDNHDAAIADYTKAIELINSDLAKSLTFAARASIYTSLDQPEKAIKDYDEAIRLTPDFAYHYYHRGRLYLKSGNLEKALADYSTAIQKDGKNQFFYHDRAKAYRKLGKDDLAVADEANAKLIESGAPPTSVTEPTP